MLKLFQAATALRAITDRVRAGYASSPNPPWVVRYHVRNAPTAIVCTVAGSDNARWESGALGLLMSRVPQPARTRATTAPAISGIRLVRLIAIVSSEVRFTGLEVDFHEAGELAEVRVREAIDPERERITRQPGDFGIIARVLRERDQVAPDHSYAQAVDAEVELLHRRPRERVADVQLFDLHVRPRLDEEVDRVDAVVQRLVVLDRLLAGRIRAVRRIGRAGAVHRRLVRLIDDAVAVLEERPLPRRIVDVAALHPVDQRVGREALEAQGAGEAGVEVGVHVPDLDGLLAGRRDERNQPLADRVVLALPHQEAVFVHDDRVWSPGPTGHALRGLRGVLAQLSVRADDFGPVDHAEGLTGGDPEHLRHVIVAGIIRPDQIRRGGERRNRLTGAVSRDVDLPREVRLVGQDHAQGHLMRVPDQRARVLPLVDVPGGRRERSEEHTS